jgi:hypothetical protein
VFDDYGQLGVLSTDNAANQQRQGVQMAPLLAADARVELQQTASYGTIAPVRVAHVLAPFGSLVANLEGDPITPGTYSFPNMFSVR